jgi:hypothetical protein
LPKDGIPRVPVQAGACSIRSTGASPNAAWSIAAPTGRSSVRPALIVHGGAGPVPDAERPLRQAAVERAQEAGWSQIGSGALAAAVAAVRHLEDASALCAVRARARLSSGWGWRG